MEKSIKLQIEELRKELKEVSSLARDAIYFIRTLEEDGFLKFLNEDSYHQQVIKELRNKAGELQIGI